jgi:gliding motility-associated-like protein
VCEGTPATFKEISTVPAGVTLASTHWIFGDGSPIEIHAPGSIFTHAFPAWGNYTVTMFNTSAYGCKSTSHMQQVYISPIPQAAFAFKESSVCLPNASVSFINNAVIADGSTIMYAWDFGDPSSGLLNNSTAKTPPPHIYTGTGPYPVKLIVTSSNTCTNTNTQWVDFIHPQPKAAFDFSKPEICVGDDVTFRDITNGLDGTVQQWYWDMGDGIKANTPQVQHWYTTAKTYGVSLYIINSRGCNSDTMTQQFTVHPYPVVDAGPDRLVLQGGSITIQSVATGNDLKYLWSPITYLNNTTDATPVANNMLDDITYTLTVTARGGCKRSDDMFVKVLKAPQIPNTFTPNGDGINELWLIGYLDTYPDNRVQVFTRTGQLVFESRGYKTAWDGKLNGKPLPFDTYYYIIEPGNGRAPITGYVTIVK